MRSLFSGSNNSTPGDNERALVDGRRRLLALGLVEGQEPEEGSNARLASEFWIGCHRLVRAYASSAIPADVLEATGEVVETAVGSELYRLTESDPRPLLAWQSHLRHVTDAALARKGEGAATLANNLGFHLQQAGDYAGAREYYERALAIAEKVLGPDHPGTATSLNNLGELLRTQGDYEGVRPYLGRALAIAEKVLGPKHPDTAQSLNNLGELLRTQGDYDGARAYYERALAIREQVLGPEHPSTAISLNNLGGLLQAQGDYAGARGYYERAQAIKRKVLGQDHPSTRITLDNLARLDERGFSREQ